MKTVLVILRMFGQQTLFWYFLDNVDDVDIYIFLDMILIISDIQISNLKYI
jgi:hypothetical protein